MRYRKQPFTPGQIRRIVKALRAGRTRTGRVRAPEIVARDAAIFLVGFTTGLGCEEQRLLDLEDLELSDRGATLTVTGVGRRSIERIGGPYCPVAALEAWLEVRGREPGALFVRTEHGRGKRLSIFGMWNSLAQSIGTAGLPITDFGPGSFLQGFQAAVERGGGEAAVVRLLAP